MTDYGPMDFEAFNSADYPDMSLNFKQGILRQIFCARGRVTMQQLVAEWPDMALWAHGNLEAEMSAQAFAQCVEASGNALLFCPNSTLWTDEMKRAYLYRADAYIPNAKNKVFVPCSWEASYVTELSVGKRKAKIIERVYLRRDEGYLNPPRGTAPQPPVDISESGR